MSNSSKYFRHKKTGEVYQYLGRGIDATNVSEGRLVIIYADFKGNIFTRERQEFIDKFLPISKDQAEKLLGLENK